MKILDANLLVYATDRDSPVHEVARAFVDEATSGDEPVGVPWSVILAFLRVATNPRALRTAISVPQAIDVVDRWFDRPAVFQVRPGERH